MKNVALIPLRGGSKGIIKKNIKLIAGKPLCEWVLCSAVNSDSINEVFVSTDSKEISGVVEDLKLGIEVINRPPEISTDTASTESVMLHFMEKVNFDNLVTIQATSPLLESVHLDQAFEHFVNNQFDSLLSIVKSKNFFWNENGTPVNYDYSRRPRRQEFKGMNMENGAFYITKKEILQRTRCRLGGNIGFYEMPKETAFEIDEEPDWVIVSNLLNKRYNLE